MTWVFIALASAAVSGVVNILDKTVLYRYARSPKTLPLLIGVAQTFIGIVVLAIVRIPNSATLSATATAFGAGVIFGVSGNILMRVLYRQEVSRTIPLTQTAPIYAAIFAMLFLDESITALHWVAICATVVGAVTLSLKFDSTYRSVFLQKSFFVLMLGAMLFATANLVSKVALEDLPVLYTHAMRCFGLGSVFLIVNLRREPVANVVAFFKERSPALAFVGVNELILANGGLLLLLWALSLGPASLVIAVAGTRSMWVVAYSTLLALRWRGALGEVTTPGVIAIKVASTALIVAGVTGIAL